MDDFKEAVTFMTSGSTHSQPPTIHLLAETLRVLQSVLRDSNASSADKLRAAETISRLYQTGSVPPKAIS